MNSRGLLIIIALLSNPLPCLADTPKDAAQEAQASQTPQNASEAAISSPKDGGSAGKHGGEEKLSEQPKAAEATPVGNKHLVGNAAAGKDKTQTCVACHNADGNSTVGNWPKIAGQYENYLVKQLHDFRAGEKGPRFEASMYAMVANLTDQDIADLASFYTSEKQTMGKAQNAYVALGQKIYRGGNVHSGVTACLACHGPEGLGNEAAKFPKLAGQHAVYIENQLIAFREGKRTNSPNGMMESISHRMSNEEMKAVSSYIEGLR